jgi:hypothetical protein
VSTFGSPQLTVIRRLGLAVGSHKAQRGLPIFVLRILHASQRISKLLIYQVLRQKAWIQRASDHLSAKTVIDWVPLH